MAESVRTINVLQQRLRKSHTVLQEHRRALRIARDALRGIPLAEAKAALVEVESVLGEDE